MAPKTTYRYRFKGHGRVVYCGIITDLARREHEHRCRWPTGCIEQVGSDHSRRSVELGKAAGRAAVQFRFLMSSHKFSQEDSETTQNVSRNRVLVNGARLTRALVPGLPLLVHDFDNDVLEGKGCGLPSAGRLLDWRRNLHPRGYVDIERLMTRLDALRLRRECGQRGERTWLPPVGTEEDVSRPVS